LRNTADAEDVARKLCYALSPVRSPARPQPLPGWLVRIAFRLALDRLRSGKRRELRDTLWSQPERQPPAATVEDTAASNEFQAHLENALAELRKNYASSFCSRDGRAHH